MKRASPEPTRLAGLTRFWKAGQPGQASWPFPCNRSNRVNTGSTFPYNRSCRVNTGLTRCTRMRFDHHSSYKMAAAASASAKKFSWTSELVENLIKSLSNFKTRMEFMNKDFNGDKPRQYEEVRKEMARIYCSIDIKMFGPETVTIGPCEVDVNGREEAMELIKEEQQLIKRGYNRVMEKIKKIRQNFSSAVISGRRSGSGKVVMEHYDDLVAIFGGSPSTEPLEFGCKTGEGSTVETEPGYEDEHESLSSPSSANGSRSSTPVNCGNNFTNDELVEDVENPRKRKNVSAVPKLIDEKRKHLEKSLSSKQRDQLLLREAREDATFRKDLCDSIRQSNDQFADAMKAMSNSFVQVAECMKHSMDALLAMNNAPAPAPPMMHGMHAQNFAPQRSHLRQSNIGQATDLSYYEQLHSSH